MRSASPSRSSCELNREGAAPRQAGPRRSGACDLRTSTNDRYRRQNAPFMIIAVNHEVGWISAVPDLPGPRRPHLKSGHLLPDATAFDAAYFSAPLVGRQAEEYPRR